MVSWNFVLRIGLSRPGLFAANAGVAVSWKVATLAAGLVTRGILDTLSDGERAGVSPWALVAVLLALGVVELLGVMGEAFAYFLRKFLIGALLRTNAFNHGLDRFDGLASRPSSGDAVNRLREDVDYIINAVAEWPLILAGLLEAAAAVVILATVDAQATFVVVVPVVLVFVVAALARQRIERYRRASRTSSGNVSDLIGTIFGAAETIKAAGAESRVMKRFDELNAARAELTIKDEVFGQVVRSGFAQVATVGLGVILMLGAESVRSGEFTVGDLALFVLYLRLIQDAVQHFASEFLRPLPQITVSMERLEGLLYGGRRNTSRSRLLSIFEATCPPYRRLHHERDARSRSSRPRGLPTPIRGPITVYATSTCASSAVRLRLSPEGSAPARRRCSERSWGRCLWTPGRYGGTGALSKSRVKSWSPLSWPTPHRRLGCLVNRCATTCSWDCPKQKSTFRELSRRRCSNGI